MREDDKQREPGLYWVLPVYDVDAPGWDYEKCERVSEHWSNEVQPAYWDGEVWNLMGTEDWDVRWVGDPIAPVYDDNLRRIPRETAPCPSPDNERD